mmetsp:Transcript_1564/g.3901  ORF Transcript_1564/g.3901 Transcript_1564/m.3901 type:complete len:210 (-) Transcript_1564:5-634(-)
MHRLKGGRRCCHRRRQAGHSAPSGAAASAAAAARRCQSASLHPTRPGPGRTTMLRGVPRRSPPSTDSQSHRSWPKAARRCAATRARPQRQLGWLGRRRRTPLPRGRRWPRSGPRGWRCSLGPLPADVAARRATAAAASASRSRRARRMGGARPGPGRLAAGSPAVAAPPAPRVSALDAAAWARRLTEARRWRPRWRPQWRRSQRRRCTS